MQLRERVQREAWGERDHEICALLSGRSQMKEDGVSQIQNYSKSGIKQHLIASPGLQFHQKVSVDQGGSHSEGRDTVVESG